MTHMAVKSTKTVDKKLEVFKFQKEADILAEV